MKKTLICALALLTIAGGAFAATGTIDLYTDFNLIALPNVPIDPVPANIFAGYALDSMISGWDPVTGSNTAYSDWAPEEFGNLLLGEGWWLSTPAGGTVTFEGLESGVPATAGGAKTDMWISMPGYDSNFDGTPDAGGWHLVGNPYAELVNMANFSFTDGTSVKTWQEACDAGWIADNFQGFDGANQASTLITVDGWNLTDFESARAYWVETYVPNLAMIITAP